MNPWRLRYDKLEKEDPSAEEALCAVGNGYMAARGAGAEARAKNNRYPGFYLAGGYDRAETEFEDHVVENEDLVNWPNWLPLSFKLEGEEWFDLDSANVLSFKKELILEEGGLFRMLEIEDASRRKTLIEERRFVSMDDKNAAAVEWKITPLNWSGKARVMSMLDGAVENKGVKRYRSLTSRHLKICDKGVVQENMVFLKAKTLQSEIVMAQAARTDVFEGANLCSLSRENFQGEKRVGQIIEIDCKKRKTYRVEKIVSVYTSKDFAISNPRLASVKYLRHCGNFDYLYSKHKLKWRELWFHFDVKLENMPAENLALRMHIFHLLQTASHNTIDIDASVPARGLHGEAYRGHIFWDELFIFPFYYFRMPELARSLLMYRFRRLREARRLAREAGYEGAMYPWQSGSDGDEESQELHLNPNSGRWVPDNTNLQRHINGAIVYNIVKYYEATDDHEFMYHYGAEMVFEICKFWASAAKLNAKTQRYELWNMMGPDEFHTRYPGAERPGLRNNAYTNYLASWSLKKALQLYALLSETRKSELLEDLDMDGDDLDQWEKISKGTLIPFQGEGIISQFSGYEDLLDFDWEKYKEKYGDISRLDRILEAEGDDVNRYKVNKQADVLMLFYLFSAAELEEHCHWMNYVFDTECIPKNIRYYLGQSSHGSTLSRITHSWVLARTERSRSWQLFKEALDSDLMDIQKGTTGEGIHLGAMAGTVDIAQRCFTGIEIRRDALWFNPMLPEELSQIEFRMRYRSHWLRVRANHHCLKIDIERSWVSGGKIGFKDKVFEFQQGDAFEFPLNEASTRKSPPLSV